MPGNVPAAAANRTDRQLAFVRTSHILGPAGRPRREKQQLSIVKTDHPGTAKLPTPEVASRLDASQTQS